MQITNLTANDYDLPGLRLHANETVTFDVARYTGDDRFRLEVNTLVANGKISVASAPIGFPIQTALEAEIARGEVPGAATPGGYVPARNVGQVNLSATGIVVNGATQSAIPWTFAQGDEDMLDISVPTTPAPVNAGVYAYAAFVTQFGGGDGSPFYSVLTVDNDFYGLTISALARGLADPEYPEGVVPIGTTWYSTAGSSFQTLIGNSGMAGSDTFEAVLYVQRIT